MPGKKRKLAVAARSLRIGVVWYCGTVVNQKCLNGIYHAAERAGNVTVRRFDALSADFTKDVIRPLREWRVDGVIVRMVDWGRLKRLRRGLPGVPIIATMACPANLVDVRVAAASVELFSRAKDYFLTCGVPTIGQFCVATESVVPVVTATFRDVVPDGLVVVCPRSCLDARTAAQKKRLEATMSRALTGLPKPVGLVTVETEAARFLQGWCQRLGHRVPEDVQIIGIDDEDECLACEPHLSSLAMPNERIGRTAVETLLARLRGEDPPAIIRVPGATVIPRGSTRMRATSHPAVARALDALQAQAAGGVTVDRVTRLSGVAKTTFYKRFSETTGSTPARHARRLRVEKARQLLRDTGQTVGSVAEACGFGSRVGFIQFFRRETGETPTAYRQRVGPSGEE